MQRRAFGFTCRRRFGGWERRRGEEDWVVGRRWPITECAMYRSAAAGHFRSYFLAKAGGDYARFSGSGNGDGRVPLVESLGRCGSCDPFWSERCSTRHAQLGAQLGPAFSEADLLKSRSHGSKSEWRCWVVPQQSPTDCCTVTPSARRSPSAFSFGASLARSLVRQAQSAGCWEIPFCTSLSTRDLGQPREEVPSTNSLVAGSLALPLARR